MSEVQRFRVNPVVSCGDEGEEGTVLFNPDTDDTALINPTGREIWGFLEAPRTVAEIAAHLGEEFEESPDVEEVTRDVVQFLRGLVPDYVEILAGDDGGSDRAAAEAEESDER